MTHSTRRETRDDSERSRRAGPVFGRALGYALCFGVGFAAASPLFAGSKPDSPRRETTCSEPELEPQPAAALVNQVRAVERGFPIRPQDLCEADDPEAELRYRKQQSRELVRLLGQQVRASAGLVGILAGPQAVANQISPYLIGFSDAIVRTAPDLVEELASEMEAMMCNDSTSEAELIAVARVMQRMPELGNARAFDCVIERDVEDSVVWETLEAWRRTPLEKSAALSGFEQEVTSDELRAQLTKHPAQARGEDVSQQPYAEQVRQERAATGEPPPHGPALAIERLETARARGEDPSQLLSDAIHQLRWGKQGSRARQEETSAGSLEAEHNP